MKGKKGKIFSIKVTDGGKEQDDEYGKFNNSHFTYFVMDLAFKFESRRYQSAFIISYDKF